MSISQKYLEKIPHFLTLLTISFFLIGLSLNINYVKFPNSDFFQYINDGAQYLNFKLPSSIHPPPFAPIIICLTSKLFSNAEYPELFNAHLINILCSVLTLLNIYLLFSRIKPWLGFFIISLTATNKIYFTNSLNITNEVIFAYFLSLTLLLYSRKHYPLSYFLAGISFLIRYEAVIIPISFFLLNLFKKNRKNNFYYLFLSFLPIFLWLIVLNFHSQGTSIFQNAYINEMVVGKNNIPNPNVISSLLSIILTNPTDYFLYVQTPISHLDKINIPHLSQILNTGFSLIFILLCFKSLFSKNEKEITKLTSLNLILLLIFTSAFPNFSIRYLFPIIWIIYLIIINRKNKIIGIIIPISLIIFNLLSFSKHSVYDTSQDKAEYRLVADWINQQKFKEKTLLLIYDPGALTYFIHNKDITIDINSYQSVSNIFTECDNNIECVLQKKDYQNNKNIIIVTQNSSTIPTDKLNDKYTQDNLHHISAFNDNKFFTNPNFKLKETLSGNQSSWAKIYFYQP